MYFCYLDESGCTGVLPHARSDVQPLFVPAAVIVKQEALQSATRLFLEAKRRFFPGLMSGEPHHLTAVLKEVKGSELRRAICATGRNRVRQTQGFLDQVVSILEKHDAKIVGRVLVKGFGVAIDGRSIYTSSVQAICGYFQQFLVEKAAVGLMIADSRSKAKNSNLSHSIFTQKFSIGGDRYSRILEMPSFGHSENHVGLQLADLLCSAFLFPMAAHSYCEGHVSSVHVQRDFRRLRERYGARLKRLQFLYRDQTGKMRGGITVDDRLGRRSSAILFSAPVPPEENAASFVGELARIKVSETLFPTSTGLAPSVEGGQPVEGGPA